MRMVALLLAALSGALAQPVAPVVSARLWISGPQPARAIAAPIVFRAAGSAAPVRLRASPDGATWTEWLETSGGEAPGEMGLVFFDQPCRYVQVDSPAANLEILFIDPGVTPKERLEEIRKSARRAAAPDQRSGVTPPPLVTREQWGCTPQTCPAKEAPAYTPVTHLIVHHTAGVNTATDWPAVVRSIWALHVQGNGWNDIGYNYLIDPDGVLYEGRAGGDGVLGAHFSGVNSGTMGVALMGTYSVVALADGARGMLQAMLAWQADKWKLDAAGQSIHRASGLLLNTISGHRDAGLSPRATSTTECPGNALYALLPQVRAEVWKQVSEPCPISISQMSMSLPPEGGPATITFTTPATCDVSASTAADWIGLERPSSGSVLMTIPGNQGVRRTGSIDIGGRTVTLTQAALGEWPLPCIATSGIVSAAGFDDRPVAPGSLVSIFGTNLAAQDNRINGCSVAINGRDAPVFYAVPGQINAQLPAETNTGTARAVVSVNGITGPDAYFWVTEAAPAIFTFEGNRALAQNHEDGRLNAPEAPVRPGSVLIVYLTGVGAAGLPASATVGGRPAGLLYLGPTPGFPGLYQANLIVPSGLPPGDHALVVTVSGVPSKPTTISVAANSLCQRPFGTREK